MSRARIFRGATAAHAPGFAAVSKEDLHSLGTKRRTLAPKDVLLEQAEELKASAIKEGLEEGFKAGFQEGIQAGFAEGEAKAYQERLRQYEQEIALFVRDLDEVTARIGGAVDRWYEAAEERIAGIVTQVAQRLLEVELATNPEAIIGIVRSSLQEIGTASKVRVRINPFDLPSVTEHRDALIASASGLRSIEIVEDPTLTGGCVLESDTGVIDASLATMTSLMESRAA